MRRSLSNPFRILALVAALTLVHGCKERERFEKEAPVLARADFRVDRIAVVGVVSDIAALDDSTASRAGRSQLIGERLGRDRFGKLPIVSYFEVRQILGQDDHDVLLDRFKRDGACDRAILADLQTIFAGKARFIVFGNIQDDRIEHSESENETYDKKTKKTISKIKKMTTSRTTSVRLLFYDLADLQLAWDHVAVGQWSKSKDHDMTDVIEHDSNESFLGGLVTSLANSVIKPDPRYPATPELERSLADAFDNVGAYLKPPKKK
jgi:hypothetical protein